MSYGFGGFAGGFMRGFLQAQRYRMDREEHEARMQLLMQAKYKGVAQQGAYNQGYNNMGGAAPKSAPAGGGSPKGMTPDGTVSGSPYKGSLDANERDLMIRTLSGEAGSESPTGQAAVAHVIINRAQDSRFGKNGVAGVITAPKQFSTWNPGDPAGEAARKLPTDSAQYKALGNIVDGVVSGKIPDPTNGATNFYNPKGGYGTTYGAEGPTWAASTAKENDVTIGNHRFTGRALFDLTPNSEVATTAEAPPAKSYGGPTAHAADGTPVPTDKQGRAIDPATGKPTVANSPPATGQTPAASPAATGQPATTGNAPKGAPKAPGALFVGDSRALGASLGRGGESIAVQGKQPDWILDNLKTYADKKQDLSGRDIYLSPGTANLMKDGKWDQAAWDNGGKYDFQNQLLTLKGYNADMSRVHVIGAPSQYGGDHANDDMQDLTEGLGAKFHVLDNDSLHPPAQGYDELFQNAGMAQTAAAAQGANTAPPAQAIPTAPVQVAQAAQQPPAATAPPPLPAQAIPSAPQPDMPPPLPPSVMPPVLSPGADGFSRGGVVKGYADGGDVTDEGNPDGAIPEAALPPPDDTQGATPADFTPEADRPAADAQDAQAPSAINPEIALPNIMTAGYDPYGANHDRPRWGEHRMPRVNSGSTPMLRSGIGRTPSMRGIGGGDTIDPLAPEISDAQGNLAPGAVGAIQAGLEGILSHFGLGQQGAIPGDPRTTQALNAFRSDEGLSPEQMAQVGRAVDPTGTLDGSMRNIAGLESVYRYAVAQGDIAGAKHWAGAILLAGRTAAARYGDEAYNLLHKGDVAGACKALSNAYDCAPDGKTAHATPNSDGTVSVTRTNMQGQVIDQHTVSPQDLMGAAIGMKNGTAYWQVLEDAAGQAPSAKSQPLSPAMQQYETTLGGGQTPQGATQLPAPSQQSATPQARVASAEGASPQLAPQAQPVADQAIPDQTQPQITPVAASAAPVTSQGNPQGTAEGAIPDKPIPLPTPASPEDMSSSLQDYSRFRAQALRAVGWQPQAPPQLTSPIPGNIPAGEVPRAEAMRKAALTQWNLENRAREAQAEKLATQWVSDKRAGAMQDRQTQGETAKLVLSDRLEKQREDARSAGEDKRMQEQEKLRGIQDADSAYRTALLENQKFVDGQDSGGDWAKEVLPKAFADKGDSPTAAAAKFNDNFGDASDLLANAARSIGVATGTNRAVAAQVVAGIVKPNLKDRQSLGFTFEQNAHDGFDVTFNSNGLTASVPKNTMAALMKLRLSVIQGASQKAANQSALTEANANDTDSFDRTGAVREPSALTGIAQGQAAMRQRDAATRDPRGATDLPIDIGPSTEDTEPLPVWGTPGTPGAIPEAPTRAPPLRRKYR